MRGYRLNKSLAKGSQQLLVASSGRPLGERQDEAASVPSTSHCSSRTPRSISVIEPARRSPEGTFC